MWRNFIQSRSNFSRAGMKGFKEGGGGGGRGEGLATLPE